jgi:hypothetical protein
MKPLVLDFDQSVEPLPGEQRIDLHAWQERIRFACTRGELNSLKDVVDPELLHQPGITFLGSGDFHHVSYLLIEHQARLHKGLQVIVFDNHPDNMRYPFGIHCGSWVWHVSRLPFVSRVHVVGITSKDVELTHAWENHFRNLYSGKVRYWCLGLNLDWMRSLGIHGCRRFTRIDAMLTEFHDSIDQSIESVYLSIDKDVLCLEDARTNWDQGVMRLSEIEVAIGKLKSRVVASDVTGDISQYTYQSRLKRFLSGLDGQPQIVTADLERWQAEHQAINLALLRCLAADDTKGPKS